MRLLRVWFICSILLWITSVEWSNALSVIIPANSNFCFNVNSNKKGQRLSFAFAVEAGGAYDIDYQIIDPELKVVESGSKQKHADLVLEAGVGEYAFCFSNAMSTFSEKVVDFDIFLEETEVPLKPATDTGIAGLDDSLRRIINSTNTIIRMQKYFMARELRNMVTAKSTDSRIFWFNIVGCTVLVGMSCLQVFIVRAFFRSDKKRAI